MSDPICPLCARATNQSRELQVCPRCHDELHAASNAQVSTTGEFSLGDMLAYSERAQMVPVAAAGTADSAPSPGVACTWCGRPEADVRKLLSQGDAHICNACVALCADIMRAELGEDWSA